MRVQQHGHPLLKLQPTAQSPFVVVGERSEKAKLTLTALHSVKPAMAEEFPSHHAVLTGRIRVQSNRFRRNENGGIGGQLPLTKSFGIVQITERAAQTTR